jgi:hypothetical protein
MEVVFGEPSRKWFERQSWHQVRVTRRNSSCGFCPPNGPGEAVEVMMPRRIGYTAHEYEITGTLQLFTSPSTGLYYRLVNASARRSR